MNGMEEIIKGESPWGCVYKQGAEAKIYKTIYLCKPVVVKERFVKSYRNSVLDLRLTKERIRSEARSILRCKIAGIKTPVIYLVDFERRIIIMESIENSETVKTYIMRLSEETDLSAESMLYKLSVEIGKILGKMHENNIVHGDLTTSNMLLNPNIEVNDTSVCLIDFGLSHAEASPEDKAVDLYVLERALLSTHSNIDGFFDNILKSYTENYTKHKLVLDKFSEVRARGRKRTMVG